MIKFYKALLIILLLYTSGVYSQMGKVPTFPFGEVRLQSAIPETVKITCVDSIDTNTVHEYVLHTLKYNPKFPDTKPSYFTGYNVKNYYLLLTQTDSSSLYIEDADLSLIKFLRYKTVNYSLQYDVVDSASYFVNVEKFRTIRWQEPLRLYLFEDGISYITTFNRWTEYWMCGDKLDYAPAYPFIRPEECSLWKENKKGFDEDLYYYMTHPIFVFSAIGLDDNSESELLTLSGKSRKFSMQTADGKKLTGRAIDINGDDIKDAFWYVEIVKSKVAEWFARLYVNIEGKWVLMWYNYFHEMQ